MIEGDGGARLLDEAAVALSVVVGRVGEDFEGDGAVELHVARQETSPMPPAPRGR
jgi:hypothetical protein